ncbi:MAG: formamidopyrimidine-DNA glycosylase [Cycloclasticus pugetii]|jgi:formamidopyrimidine-DNA glycosylase|uniref:bifunctional DNA-formamidopyrimidine glycosylase/DNA-(apurinic or apyrimidinic site) lyase n=1 Tax=Cycloclasticus pugetii TaxID=34068 RepID=UPI0039E246FB
MPELPEVETTRRGIAPHIEGKQVSQVIVRQAKLRWPVSPEVSTLLPGLCINHVKRRAKYLLLETDKGTLIIHLGMSGSLRIVQASTTPEKHEHIDIIFSNNTCLRYKDPRRFGSLLWSTDVIENHKLIQHLGPEPLSDAFNIDDFYPKAQLKKTPIKSFIMDGQVVVGVGNIYASEALFQAGIRPKRAANKVSKKRLINLVFAIKKILAQAIQQGGTTLKDFVNSDGNPGYFQQTLNVYGQKDKPCPRCKAPIKQIIIAQRSTFYCTHCQR